MDKLKEYNYKPFRVYDGNAMFIGGYIMMYLLQFIFTLILVLTDVGQGFVSTTAGMCILLFLNELAFTSEAFIYGKIKGYNPLKTTQIKNKITLKQVIMVIVLAVLCIVAFMPLANIFGSIMIKIGYPSSATALNATENIGSLFLFIFFAAVLPAIGEEMLFRGSMAKAYREKGYLFAILFSAMMFSLMHGNPLQLIHQFFLGIVCAVVYFATKSLWASIMLHFCNNLIALVGDYIMVKGNMMIPDSYITYIVYAAMTIVGVVLLVLMLNYFIKDAVNVNGKREEAQKLSSKGIRKRCDMLGLVFDDESMTRSEDIWYNERLQLCENEEEKEVVTKQYIDMRAKAKKKDRNSMFFAVGLVLVVWIINTVTNFMSNVSN